MYSGEGTYLQNSDHITGEVVGYSIILSDDGFNAQPKVYAENDEYCSTFFERPPP